MDKNEVNSAFEILLEEIEAVVDAVNDDVAKAAQARDYERVRALADTADRVIALHGKIHDLQDEWLQLAPAGRAKSKVRQRRHGTRLRKGLRTPEREFRRPLLETLVEMGGKGPIGEVVDAIGRKMKGTLNEYDRQPLPNRPTHQLRWRNTAEWSRRRMVVAGLLKSGSPQGVWEISGEGRKALERMS